jgi:hypothetical protein
MVASSQDKSSGRWWRSKRRIGESDTSDHASFSTEQGLGVYNYMVKKADKSAFSNWLEWIDANPRIYAPLPSYCTHKECVFKVIDCPLLVTVASHFNLAVRATSVCNPLRALDLPDPGQLEKGLQDALNGLLGLASKYEESRNKLIGKIGEALGIDNVDKLLPAPIKDLQAQANGAIQAFKDAREKILGPQIGEAAARLAQAIALLNSAVNGIDIQDSSFKIDTGKLVFRSNSVTLEDANITIDPGKIVYNPNGEHIAAVEVFMLRNLGYQSDVLNRAAEIIDERDKDNPFFEYLAHGRSDYMLELIVRKCPSRKNPYRPSTRRFQWFPERGEDLQGDTQQTAYAESMYWDCLFLSDLYERDIDSALAKDNTGSDPLSLVGGALRDVSKLLADLKAAADKLDSQIADIDKKIKDATPIIGPYCERNYCPPVIPPVDPAGDYCKHNPCPHLPFGL